LERIIESGLRVATMHTGGDKDIDHFMDAIEEGSKRAGFTIDEIRAKRHAFDHGAGAPRPEQIPRMKQLGVIASQINTILWETHRGASMIAKQYGTEYTSWVVPRKRLTEAGIQTGFEIDRPLPHKVFFFILKGMNRFNDRDQKVYGPDQRTDRIVQLKALTSWGAYYLMKEKVQGTLEPGKLADFIVLDRDILTIPEAEIPDTKVLMTAVGGKVVHLTPALATEFGMQAVGPTTWKEPIPDGWQ
jgi:predicted amidohydrolase YtcJ